MKKLLSYADCLVAVCGMLGAGLRQWMLSSGPDEKGLYPAGHPGWILLLILTAAVLAGIWMMSRKGLSIAARPPIFSAVGAFAGAAGLVSFGIGQLGDTAPILKIAGLLGICAAAILAFYGISVLLDKKPFSLTHLLPCLTFALLMFVQARGASREPELSRYILQLAAVAASAIAFYQQFGFDVAMGNEKANLFWRLCALYLCLIAAPGSYALLFTGTALYHLLCHRTAVVQAE